MKHLAVFTLAFFSVSACALERTAVVPRTIAPLAAWKMLDTPRSALPIGAQWQQGVGPLGAGLSSERLRTSSGATSVDLSSSSTFRAQIIAKVAQAIGIDGAVEGSTNSGISLRAIQVVGVADLTGLTLVPGSTYIWEGLSVSEFSFTDNQGRAAAVKSAITNRLPEATVAVTDGNSIVVRGSNLFVAYRLVRLGPLQLFETEVEGLETDSNKRSERYLRIGTDYSVDFEPMADSEQEQLTAATFESFRGREAQQMASRVWVEPRRGRQECSVAMVVSAFNELEAARPRVRKWGLGCNASLDDGRYFVSARLAEDTVLLDELILTDFQTRSESVVSNERRRAVVHGRMRLIRRRMPLQPVAEPSAPGW